MRSLVSVGYTRMESKKGFAFSEFKISISQINW